MELFEKNSEEWKKMRKRIDLRDIKTLESRWISMMVFDKTRTRQDVIDHIEQSANSEITEKDIYLVHRQNSRVPYFVRIRCPNKSEAQELVRTLNLSTLDGTKVFAEMEYSIEGSNLKVLLGNLDENVTEQDIADHLGKYGKIKSPLTSITLKTNKKQTRKWAEIVFKSDEDANKIVRNLNCSTLKGRELVVDWWIDMKKEIKSNRELKEITKSANKVKLNDGTSGIDKLNKRSKRLKQMKQRRFKKRGTHSLTYSM